MMQQRYDISLDSGANSLLIKEFAVLEQLPRKNEFYDPLKEEFTFLYKMIYDANIIREAIEKGKDAVISELRTEDFFPIRHCVEKIAEKVIEVFENGADPFVKVFFNDRSLFLSADEDKN
jgi:hypothetical protein